MEIETEQLKVELTASQTDLVRFLEAARRSDLPYLVIASQAVRAWEQREPDVWARFSAWLAARGKHVVEV